MFNLPKITELSWKQCMWFSFLTEDAFSLLYFFSVFFFHLDCAKYKSQDDTSVTYGRDWWQARSYMSRHTVPLYLFMRGVSVNHFACICTFWTQILEVQEKKAPIKASIVLFYFLLFFGASLDNSTWLWRDGFPQALCQSEIQYCDHLPCREYSFVAVLL